MLNHMKESHFQQKYADKMKKLVVGNQKEDGFLSKLFLYVLLTGIGFVFVYPLLLIFSTSIKNIFDLVNPLVNWIPETFYWDNYNKAYHSLGGVKILFTSIRDVGIIAIGQTFIAGVIGYGLAKYDFFGKKLIMALIIATFIIPEQLLFIPQYVMFSRYGLLNSILPVLLPSLLGQGLKNAIFILIFYQTFRLSPKSLDEAAFLDGAGHLKTFLLINMRMATPAIVVNTIFSLVWNWNNTSVMEQYFGNKNVVLTVALQRLKDAYANLYPFDVTNDPLLRMNRGVEMAGTMLAIIPLIILYVLVERHLVESIDKAGITGE